MTTTNDSPFSMCKKILSQMFDDNIQCLNEEYIFSLIERRLEILTKIIAKIKSNPQYPKNILEIRTVGNTIFVQFCEDDLKINNLIFMRLVCSKFEQASD
jgi:hypothetical protein